MSVKVTVDRVREFEAAIAALADRRVMAGFPHETASRQGDPITNAELAYIHNYGAPEANIPPRPFMEPAIEGEREGIAEELKQAAKAGLEGGVAELDKHLHRVGMIAQNAIRNKIDSNIPPPLATTTLDARKSRGVTRTHTLIDTGRMRTAATYVIRLQKSGRDIAVGT